MTLGEARVWARAGVLAALALVLGYVETFIPLPVPVPGIKLGLGNIAILVALKSLDVKSAAIVALVKVLAAGFLFGNPVMMLYSAGGTVLAFAAMAALTRVRSLSVVLVAIAGAILHNAGQLAVASVILGTPLVWATAPVLVIAACATGALSGVAARYTLDCLGAEVPSGGAAVREKGSEGDAPLRSLHESGSARRRYLAGAKGAKGAKGEYPLWPLDARVKLAFLVAFVVVALRARTVAAIVFCLAVAAALAVVARLRPKDVRAVMLPLAPILLVTIVMQVLTTQSGQVLAWAGLVAITLEALAESGRMVAGLLAIMVASVSFMRVTTTEELVATLRWLLSPLRAAGVKTDALVLSLQVAFRFVPVLASEFSQLKRAQESRLASFEGTVRQRVGAYMRLFAPLVRSAYRRADTVAEASVARCFSSTAHPTALHASRLGVRDACALIALALLIVLAVIV